MPESTSKTRYEALFFRRIENNPEFRRLERNNSESILIDEYVAETAAEKIHTDTA